MTDFPKRKSIRIENYDYSTTGVYFITVCVNNRKPILCNKRAAISRPFLLYVYSRVADCRPYITKSYKSNKSHHRLLMPPYHKLSQGLL